mmetsp:Transcript_20762/g.33966  ORF Transcript_20762/g.33966 Transcript_20762/m.33966 type:complete len:817 (+) Transcript_20762:170-2620(+)
MSQPQSTQDNLDAAAAFLRNFVVAQQQQQQQQQQPSSEAPAQAPQAQTTPAYLQQLVLAAQHHQQQQQNAAAPAPPQPPAQPHLDPNIAQLLAQAMNMAQQQKAGAPPSPAPVAPPPQPYQHVPQQQHSVSSYGSVPSSSPPASAPQHQQQSLLSTASLLGSLNPALAAALMSSALQQSTAPAAAAPVTTGANKAEPVAATHHPPVPALSVPFGLPGANAFQQHRTPPAIHSITKMQKWTLEQLESHAKELKDGGYQLPQAVAILLADARRKEEKRQAKRIANRKSACTSRARKKAKIDQLMNENAQLRRLELILSYLPDPIIVVSPAGAITFCNTQVERVFKHKVSDLVGVNIEDLMIPKSRGVMKKLIRDMLAAEQELSDPSLNGDDAKKVAGGDISGGSDGQPFGNSDHSAFPLLEVKVNSTQVDAGEDVSDSDENRRHSPNRKKSSQAAATEISSLTHKDSSFNSNEGDDATPPLKKAKVDTNGKKTNSSESDESSDQRNANANLSRNVEACKLNEEKNVEVRFSHTDDVMGAYVTANNADAKLSSLMHEPSLKTKHVMLPADKQEEQCSSTMDSSLSKTSSDKAQAKKGNSSEDSGYREGGESPEDSNSSSSCASIDMASLTRKRARPMAPSRNVCLIRSDLSTIWCEMTSSVRTSMLHDDADRGSVSKEGSVQEPAELQKEILLCFRPIQEGVKVSSDLRFRRAASQEKQSDGSGSGSNPKIPGVSESSGGGSGSNNDAHAAYTSTGADPSFAETQTDIDGSMTLKKNRPLKKRAFDTQESSEVRNKKSRPAETSAIESMMELAKKPSLP